MTQPLQSNLALLPLAPAQCVKDFHMNEVVKTVISEIGDKYAQVDTLPYFLKKYRDWICSSELNTIRGLDKFNIECYSNGTSEAFDHFYIRNRMKRFRCFKGEYMYHRLVWDGCGYDWKYIEDGPLEANDAVVVSLPFADTGNVHHLYTTQFLTECHQLNIPILIDSAFFGITSGIDFDFRCPAITDICFSLSKSFPVNNMRIGIRFSKTEYSDGLNIYQKAGYVNLLGAVIGLRLMDEYSPDFTVNKYKSKQLQYCDNYNLIPSSTVIFGLDINHVHDNYNRGMIDNNRICFATCFNSSNMPVI